MCNHEEVKQFVKIILGCHCPDEVFTSLHCRQHVEVAKGVQVQQALSLGNRLLIYITDMSGSSPLKELIPELVAAGIGERDRLGFTRFRLVITAPDVENIRPLAQTLFCAAQKGHDNVHLHIISSNEVPAGWSDSCR